MLEDVVISDINKTFTNGNSGTKKKKKELNYKCNSQLPCSSGKIKECIGRCFKLAEHLNINHI